MRSVLKLMGSGFGAHGHHARQHVDQELGLEQQILALVNFMQECHALEVDQKLKAARVSSSYSRNISPILNLVVVFS